MSGLGVGVWGGGAWVGSWVFIVGVRGGASVEWEGGIRDKKAVAIRGILRDGAALWLLRLVLWGRPFYSWNHC